MTQHERAQAKELLSRLEAIGRGQLSVTAWDVWIILSALQLAWRHPALGEPLRQRMWEIGHLLTEILAKDQLVADLAAMGWQEQLDVPMDLSREHPLPPS